MDYFVIGIYFLMDAFLSLITLNIILSWFPAVYNIKFFRVLRSITDSYMGFFRGALIIGPLDFTPIIGILLYEAFIRLFVFLVGL